MDRERKICWKRDGDDKRVVDGARIGARNGRDVPGSCTHNEKAHETVVSSHRYQLGLSVVVGEVKELQPSKLQTARDLAMPNQPREHHVSPIIESAIL